MAIESQSFTLPIFPVFRDPVFRLLIGNILNSRPGPVFFVDFRRLKPSLALLPEATFF